MMGASSGEGEAESTRALQEGCRADKIHEGTTVLGTALQDEGG